MQPKIHVEMRFCRRCGSQLSEHSPFAFVCKQGHPIFYNAAPVVGAVLYNDRDEVLLLKRGIEPGKGTLSIPGGFCDGPEAAEDALVREIQEEVGLRPEDYGSLSFVLSHIDLYDYNGERLAVHSLVFKAKVISAGRLSAGDDAASVQFVPIKTVDLDKVHFASVREGLRRLQAG